MPYIKHPYIYIYLKTVARLNVTTSEEISKEILKEWTIRTMKYYTTNINILTTRSKRVLYKTHNNLTDDILFKKKIQQTNIKRTVG